MATVQYFDLGCHDGNIVEYVLSTVGRKHDLRVWAIDANPKKVTHCQRRFANDPRVTCVNFAVVRKEGPVRLWLGTDPQKLGSSVYADKKTNVGTEWIEVPGKVFSAWFKGLGLAPAIRILKANIEGAEGDLVQDLEDAGLWSEFILFFGSADGDWTTDMRKVPSLASRIPVVKGIMSRRGIKVHRICRAQPCLDVNTLIEGCRDARSA